MAHQANGSAIPLDQALGHAAGVITRTIVNENDLIGSRKGGERRERISNQRLKVISLVVAGEEE